MKGKQLYELFIRLTTGDQMRSCEWAELPPSVRTAWEAVYEAAAKDGRDSVSSSSNDQ